MTERERIYQDSQNIVVSAGAGSGKTALLINKLKSEVRYDRTHYKVAAITFTNKSANELKERSRETGKGNFFGTNDGFIEKEIIRPFIKDALGDDFSQNFETEYFKTKFSTFDDGLEILKREGILGAYSNQKRNFKFNLAKKILNDSNACRQYIQAKYRMIFIDEYQDSDIDMHDFFMFIKDDLNIKLFIVGDPKQSIYVWRGAEPQNFKSLLETGSGFNIYVLNENFRCCFDIQNYSNSFFLETQDQVKLEDHEVEDVIGVRNECSLEGLYKRNLIDPEKELVILSWKRNYAEHIANYLNEEGYNFTYIPRTPLDKNTKNSSMLIELAKYVKNKRYSVYHLVNSLGLDLSHKEISEMDDTISGLKNTGVNKEEIILILDELSNMLQINFEEEELGPFVSVILTDEYDVAFNGQENINKVMTLHSSKGLEFQQVLIFASDFKLFQDRDLNEHYVASTRGKEKLIIMLNDNYINYLEVIQSRLQLESLNQLIKII
ncbi:ATP-dependent helicase [Alkalibacillus almallahensis]|uniref:ATP-dependent helicase n=1 Tax=Alkalibacillus almallahensis TaxID=1379154 RepID=UPI00141E8B66|nr:ATP-dependent helicase [Alkalibacillus almallahensis]NIK11755.1 ATP-dependent exoDNAse (exonuclease V) beta subunit [Alkalibacillus almallahensis]